MPSYTQRFVLFVSAASLGLFAMLMPACGGGVGGSEGAGRGLVMLSFMQDGVANAVLNTKLEFQFSEAVDPNTVTPASIQIREGDEFGMTVPGKFYIHGALVSFEPRLASLCDESDSGLKPDTQYRVQCIGNPEEFAVRNLSGQPLGTTTTHEFRTRADNDPAKYRDQIPATGPEVTGTWPLDGAEAVAVEPGNEVVIDISENLTPCSVNSDSVRFHMYRTGDIDGAALVDGRKTGFYVGGGANGVGGDTSDQTGDPFTWGADVSHPFPSPQVIPADIRLVQDFQSTQIVITPLFGQFQENALIVVQLTFDIEDYGHTPLVPHTISFTTENLPSETSAYAMEVEGETPWDEDQSSASIDTEQSPSRVQGYMLFAGDGDNGTDPNSPSLPQSNYPLCTTDYQANAGGPDHFDPTGPDVLLDTGGTPNLCANSTDGSTAVVWEYASFRIRSGVTVRIIGVNPAILLVQGEVVIEGGGRLVVRGDNTGGSPRGIGRTGYTWAYQTSSITLGGDGVAGGGDGGDTVKMSANLPGGEDGFSAFGSVDGQGTMGGEGAGEGGTTLDGTYSGDRGSAQGGGGGGHGIAGDDATSVLGTGSLWRTNPTRGHGGEACPGTPNADRMLTPSAGAGAGGGGNDEWDGSYKGNYSSGGGSGGAGGGFVDISSSGDIIINGTIDAAGSRGGDAGSSNYYTGAGGGGGGAGGGIRLLTPNEIILGGTAVVTTAGGAGGTSKLGTSAGGNGPLNHGAKGGNGRVVMEDGDSIITGLGSANVIPSEGEAGFYRGAFDASRFQGGGLTPQAVSLPFPVGPFNPTFLEPVQDYGTQEDFVAGVPTIAAIGTDKTAILVEVRGYDISADGTPDATTETDWFTVGHFIDSGIESLPTWRAGHPSLVPADPDYVGLAPDNALNGPGPHGDSGETFAALSLAAGPNNGFEFLQVRITVYLPSTVGPFDGGPFIDHWSIRFTHDQ